MYLGFASLSFFAAPGAAPAAGLYSPAHIIMLLIAACCVAAALYFTARIPADKASLIMRRIIRCLTAVLWVLEICKIVFNLMIGNADNPNSYIPLYFCSIVLYAGLMSSLGRGKLQRAGDVFLATGSVVGGLVFLIVPLTSLTVYPAIHFISFHSFILHSVMVYMGLALLITGSIRLGLRDIIGYAATVLTVCAAALVINLCCGSNLMFISQNYPSSPIELIYNLFPGVWFTAVMILGQCTLPFLAVYLLLPSRCKERSR